MNLHFLQESCDISSKEDCVHMLWLIPQYFAIVTADVMFSVTAMNFLYTQVHYYLPLPLGYRIQIDIDYIIFVLGTKKYENYNSSYRYALCSIWKYYSYDYS